MAIRLGSTNVTKVALGAATLSKVMLGTTEVWSAGLPYIPWSDSGTVTSAIISSATVRDSTTIPHDMVADIVWNSTSSGLSVGVVSLDGEYLMAEYVDDPYVAGRYYLPAGSTVDFVHRAAYATMSGSWSITAVDALPDLSAGYIPVNTQMAQNVDTVLASWAYPIACTVSNATFKADWNYTSSTSLRVLKIARGTTGNVIATSADEADTISTNGLSLAAGERLYFMARSEASSTSYRTFVDMAGEGWSVTLA